jgi:hypothetical protein
MLFLAEVTTNSSTMPPRPMDTFGDRRARLERPVRGVHDRVDILLG